MTTTRIILPFILSLGLLACRQPIVVQAPTVIQVDGVVAESISDEPPYVPTPRWKIDSTTESYNAGEAWNADDRVDGYRIPNGAVYNWGGVKAILSTDGNNIRLDCSTGGAASVYCLADGAVLVLTCEHMSFKVSCELK